VVHFWRANLGQISRALKGCCRTSRRAASWSARGARRRTVSAAAEAAVYTGERPSDPQPNPRAQGPSDRRPRSGGDPGLGLNSHFRKGWPRTVGRERPRSSGVGPRLRAVGGVAHAPSPSSHLSLARCTGGTMRRPIAPVYRRNFLALLKLIRQARLHARWTQQRPSSRRWRHQRGR
jgi:hypothetical protein